MKINLSNYTLERAEVEEDEEADVVLNIIHTSGKYSERWCAFAFTHFEGRIDVWEYQGDTLSGSNNVSSSSRYDIFKYIIENTECLAIVAVGQDDEQKYYTRDGAECVADFDSADEFVRYLILANDFEDSDAVIDFFDESESDRYPLIEAQMRNVQAAHYYQQRAKYERHFAEMSGNEHREQLAEKFAEKEKRHTDLVEWAKTEREKHGIRV